MTKGNLGINRDNGECPHARFYSTEVTKSFIAFEFRDVTGAAYQIYVVNSIHAQYPYKMACIRFIKFPLI